MPWKEWKIVEERMKFVMRLGEGESMAQACRSFGVSRKTGYKIWNRYRKEGVIGLEDRLRKPHGHGRRTDSSIERLFIQLKQEKRTWGAPKLREL